MIVICDQCGKPIKKKPANLAPHNFCNRLCAGLWRRGKSFMSQEARERISAMYTGKRRPEVTEQLSGKTQERAHRWIGDNATKNTGRHRAERWYPIKACEVCGKTGGGHQIHRHHKDGNTLNNNPENIAILCTRHHGEAHRKLNQEKKLCALYVE